ncbi:MAG: HAD-IC family P-type ATPase [Dehalococcoidia bacterium]|nr:MAG: HAD-IC family P-type ATPase [Dehalococcoidia bacterium]
MNTSWYKLTINDTLKRLDTDRLGLPTGEISKRLEQYGYNELKLRKPSVIMRFLRQFHNPLVYILLAAATVTGTLTIIGSEDMLADTVVILAVVFLNAVLGFFQEGKTEAALEALRKIIVQECTVLRNGKKSVIAARELVPGDIVVLEAGNKVPADLRLFNTKNLYIDEAVLTGESVPVSKNEFALNRTNLSPGDQRCIGFSGTFITRGSAHGIVVATGVTTEFGKVAKLVGETKRVVTPLQKQIAIFTKFLMIAILGIGLFNFILGYIFGYTTIYSFLASVSLIVAAIPEMLPMLVTAILALAAAAMVKRNALVRRLAAAETLGSTTVICSDKTGTLTKNQMTVVSIFAGGNNYQISGVGYEPDGDFILNDKVINPILNHPVLIQTLRAGFLCNNARLIRQDRMYQIIGDPTEGALIVSASKVNIDDELQRLDEIPFESEQQFMATLHRGQDENIIFIKGAPEKVLSMCHNQQMDKGVTPLEKENVLDKANIMANDALRVLGMAYKKMSSSMTSLMSSDIQGFTFLGLQGMIDPPRQEAIDAIKKCKVAGIRSIMITGDHLRTAESVARQLGITNIDNKDALNGEQLAAMNDEELYDAVKSVSIYARVAPEHKLRIAQQLQKRGEIVAMTGDGVNDAPALKAANIGVAMGITGTEVSREASDMVLTDDNFASIVAAVDEGRHAWRNLEKAILYTIPTNGGQALLVIGAVILASVLPIFSARLTLEPVMILWINLFDSVFLTMPLMMEPKDKGLLLEPPRSSNTKLANLLLLERVILIGFMIAIPGFLIYNHFGAAAVSADGVIIDSLLLTQAQTAAFWAVLMVHFGYVISARSVYNSAFTFSPFSNKWLLVGIVASILFRLLPTFVPAASGFFRTAEFPPEWWIYILPCLLPGFIAIELEKLVIRRWRKRKSQ